MMKEEEKIIEQIRRLENESQSLEINNEEREVLLKKVNNYTESFLNTLSQQKAYERKGYERDKRDDDIQIKNETDEIQDVLDLLEERIDKTGLNPASGGHLGYIPGGGIYASALGDYIAAITNRYAGVFYASPGAVRIENALINWMGKLIGYTNNFGGNLTSGGSFANLIAIATARSAGKIKSKNLESTVIYVCQQAHHSILKALKITGMEECIIRIIELDDHFRMNIDKLQLQIEKDKKDGLHPFLLLGNAGSTDVGAVDPLYEMAAIAKENHLWFHVDAAYGGFFLLTKEGKEKMKGIELADSVIMDPHKGLFIPYGLGIVMVKNVQHLLAANNFDANYMQDTKSQENEYSPSQLSPELSKHFRGLRMWLPLKLHGEKPFAASLQEKILLTRYFYEKVKLLGFKTGPFPDLSIIIFWFEPKEGDANEYNKIIL
ncbi:MAG TPA: aminotransferase class V-fold PLP-dependent enzyme, partial [Hanamia sp.]|nr:aminotransferase class V-fold PLP-dependent enzyme [Hanamia sp.]